MAKYTLLFDSSKCTGCYACEVACKQEHNLPAGVSRISVAIAEPKEMDGKLCLDFSLSRCMHCGKAPCIEACQQRAITKQKDGIVLVDKQLCDGCGDCIEACPFDAPQINPENGKIEMCTLCVHRIDQALPPACVQNCITDALSLTGISAHTR